MKDWLRVNRLNLEKDLLNSKHRKLISPVYFGQYEITLPLILANARGKLIDLGAGDMPYRESVIDLVENYDSVDLLPRSEDVKYKTDIQNMPMIMDNLYDTAICLEVLEHIPDPRKALTEINRILVPGGRLIVSVPHLSRLHDLPHDFYRYTRYGISELLESTGFNILSVHERGGLLSFIGHQFSLFWLSLFWGLPVIKWIVFFINGVILSRLFFFLDNLLGLYKYFPAGYTLLAEKK